MRLAFGIVSLFAGGGLQRDCLALARQMRAWGQDVTIFTSRVRDLPALDIPVQILPNKARTNHGRNLRFARDFAAARYEKCDLVVGFDKMPGLDVLYCADPSVAADRSRLWRLIPRYRSLVRLEAACFAPRGKARLILLSEQQADAYRSAWNTERDRITVLPPTIDRERRRPQYRSDGTRSGVRVSLGLVPEDWVWLAVGGQPHTKGFDRIISALAPFPDARLLIAGIAEGTSQARALRSMARRRGVDRHVRFLGHREDIPAVMAAADILVHPARAEVTGTVILEAIVNGLPVVTTEVCGYALHVTGADAGVVMPEPFRRRSFLQKLAETRDPVAMVRWSANAARYGDDPVLYSGRNRAAQIMLGAASAAANRDDSPR